jgi:hypothetical protein
MTLAFLSWAAAAAVAALIVSGLAILISFCSLKYTSRADKARVRAEKAAPLHHIRTLIRDVATAQAATTSDPMAHSDMKAKLAGLQAAVEAVDVDLPDCGAYANNADPALRPAAEQELERAIAAAGSE